MNPSDDNSPLGGPLELPDSPAAPRSSSSHAPKKKRSRKLVLFVLILVIIGAVLAVAWQLIDKKPSSDASQNQTTGSAQSSSGSPNPTSTSDVGDVTGTKTFKSDSLNLELIHPSSWTATEASGGVRIESPEFNFLTTQGIVTGNFRIYVRQGAREVDSKYIGAGVAIQDAEKITYTQPTSGQRKETNLQFFGLDDPDHFSFVFVAGNYSLKKGDTLGPNYGREADTFIVMGGYSGKSLADDFATYKIATTTFNQSKAYKQAIDIIKSLKLF